MSRIQNPRGFGRRRFLRTLAGGAIALPFLEMDIARGGGATVPKRFVIFSTGEGNLPTRWLPPTLGNNALELSEMLQPLAENKQYLNVVSGVSNLLPGLHTSNGHNAPGHTVLSANVVDTTQTIALGRGQRNEGALRSRDHLAGAENQKLPAHFQEPPAVTREGSSRA